MTPRPNRLHAPSYPAPGFLPLGFIPRALVLLLAAIAAVLAVPLLWVGGEIILLGGTWYYALAGVGLGLAAVLLALRRHWAGAQVLGLVVAGTLAWSLIEISGKGFMASWGFDLAGRAAVPLLLFIALVLVLLFGTPRTTTSRGWRPIGVMVLLLSIALPAALVAALWERPQQAAITADAATAFTPGAGHNAAGEWTAYGGSPLGARFTPATQITKANVSQLTEAWRMQSGDLPPNDRVYFSSQNTPIYADGRLYLCTSSNEVFALDPATGQTLWH